MPYAPELKSVVARYAKSLAVPNGLQQLHERKKHRPEAKHMALGPAIVLTSLSAFEGFLEEFVAVVGAKRGLSFAQIAKLANTNSPSLRDFEKNLVSQLGYWSPSTWRSQFSLTVFSPPALGQSNWWTEADISWEQTLDQADGWLQVRHSLAHGLTRGYLSEHWPTPMRQGLHASSVLRPQKDNKYSLTLHGAITCARVFRHSSEALVKQTAIALGEKPPSWRAVPTFPLAGAEQD
jgi:hypothetical protein